MTNLESLKSQSKLQYTQGYPALINDILKYITKVKSKDKTLSFMDIIMDYSVKTNTELEEIGDAISTDNYFKALIEKDLHNTNYMKCNKKTSDW